jgi:hypothetical protein
LRGRRAAQGDGVLLPAGHRRRNSGKGEGLWGTGTGDGKESFGYDVDLIPTATPVYNDPGCQLDSKAKPADPWANCRTPQTGMMDHGFHGWHGS